MKVQVICNHNIFIKVSFTLSDDSSMVTKLKSRNCSETNRRLHSPLYCKSSCSL